MASGELGILKIYCDQGHMEKGSKWSDMIERMKLRACVKCSVSHRLDIREQVYAFLEFS